MKPEYWYAAICLMGGLVSCLAGVKGLAKGQISFISGSPFYSVRIEYPWRLYSRSKQPKAFWFIITFDLTIGITLLIAGVFFLL
jgi:hypothetical protein